MTTRMPTYLRKLPQLAMWISSAMLNGCQAGSDIDQLRLWLAQTTSDAQAQTKATLLPDLVTAPFIPLPYSLDGTDTPFSHPEPPLPATIADRPSLRPAQRGTAQFLENFELSSLRLVGTLARGKTRHALLQADGAVHWIRPGDYLGRHFGKVKQIAEDHIVLEELWPASNGNWTKRQASLNMQGKSP